MTARLVQGCVWVASVYCQQSPFNKPGFRAFLLQTSLDLLGDFSPASIGIQQQPPELMHRRLQNSVHLCSGVVEMGPDSGGYHKGAVADGL